MINPTPALRRLEAEYARNTDGIPFPEALQRFAALGGYARRLNPAIGADWVEDLAADRAIARAVNGLPPAP